MERLTIKTPQGPALKMGDTYPSEEAAREDLMRLFYVAVGRLAAYEDTGLTPEEIDEWLYKSYGPLHQKIGRWFDAEKDGRLVVLPVLVGAGKVAYGLTDPDDGPQRIVTIECDYLEKLEIWDNPGHEVVVDVDGWEIGESDIGKTVFLTREEAEAALKKREESEK